ncbi:dihydrolipoyl dehydrogenase [Youngiibacter multivorans]|uniref:Dihydrolipoyl dehydrogenase n=1 Tax=Youngiibacter multivorans TaxID=937251 RepID=A0ABS4G0P0_9CLOT|nr:dihydrolipoyl dehydrogenase [Youngiibacter multivorans]MBP1918109.1 dihydrolipoamide dehydrogenase [Youngiibacter multivorans]
MEKRRIMGKKIVIIGGGSGGYVSAIRLSRLGNEVVLIEKDKLGGTCLNRGCIPTKALYGSAEALHAARSLDSFGIRIDGPIVIDSLRIQERKAEVVGSLVSGVTQLLKANGVRVVEGEARILDGRVLVLNEEFKYDNLIIATGSTPVVPPIKGAEQEGVVTSDELLGFEEIPRELVIIGGGVIGMELAGIMNAFGSKVTVLEAMPSILPMVDSEIVRRLSPVLKKSGIEIVTGAAVTCIGRVDGRLNVSYSTKKGEETRSADKVLLSVGRRPNLEGMGLEEAGIAYDRKGIITDENFETSVKGVYAIGDVNGKVLLAHAASAQAEYVSELISGNEARIGRIIPSCVFMFPEIAQAGETEDQLKASGIEYQVSKFQFGANGKALAMGHGEGVIKVLGEKDGRLLGVHILGPHASDLIHEAVLMMENGQGVEDARRIIHAHPTLSEAFHEAVLGLAGDAVHLMPQKRRT